MLKMHAKNYRFIGKKDGWYMFMSTRGGDNVIQAARRASMILEDGTVKVYGSWDEATNARKDRLNRKDLDIAYAARCISGAETSAV